jgi:hypothetical protein
VRTDNELRKVCPSRAAAAASGCWIGAPAAEKSYGVRNCLTVFSGFAAAARCDNPLGIRIPACRQVATCFLFAKSRATLLVAYAGELGAESLSIEHVCGFGSADYNGCRRPGTDPSTG